MAIDLADPPPITTLDIMSDTLAADPWPALTALRAQGPVVWHAGYRRWLVSHDREVRKVIVDHHRFTVEGTSVAALFGADAFIAMDDRRRHHALRDVWAAAFRQPALDRMRPVVAAIVGEAMAPLAARLRDGEAIDVNAALCRRLPTRVIARMMGVPEAMLPDVERWSDAMAGGGPAYVQDDPAAARARQAGAAAKAALADYLLTLIAERRVRPADDLVGLMVRSAAAQALADDQIVQNIRQLLFAGNETTAKWLAQIVLTLGEQTDARAEIVADRSLVPAACDEVMRWQAVTGTLVRRLRGGPLALGGVTIADGDFVTCILASANRDPARWAAPDRFDIRRPVQPNLGFGIGFHNCLGSVLAKWEAAAVVNALLDAAPDYAIAAPYRFSALPMRGPDPVVIAREGR